MEGYDTLNNWLNDKYEDKKEMVVRIKILFMDVDGTLTDGGIYMSEKGEVVKRFDVKDGYGICNILIKNGIIPAIITGRESTILERRCRELGIEEVIQGCNDKVSACCTMLQKYGLISSEAAYIGDDLNDYDVMKYIGTCGCPADAVSEIREISDFVASSCGGHGAVREFIEWIVKNNNK